MPKKSHDALDTEWIQAFIAVMDHYGFDAAAQVLGCSQSTVSDRVIKLEAWLGAPLFDHQDREQPTNLALSFHGPARKMLGELERFRSDGERRPVVAAAFLPAPKSMDWWLRKLRISTKGWAHWLAQRRSSD